MCNSNSMEVKNKNNKNPMQPATASTNRKQMLHEASVSVLGAALNDSLSSQYAPAQPFLAVGSSSGWLYKCSCPAAGI